MSNNRDKTEEDVMIGRVVGEIYRINKKIGVGGFGDVYQAVGRINDCEVGRFVVKVGKYSDDIEKHRFQDEIRILAGLEHKNIVSIHHWGELDGRPFYVMPFLSGTNLAEYIQRHKSAHKGLDLPVVAEITRQVCAGLQYIHHHHLIHRDIKPQNIMIDQYQERLIVKLIDFGISIKRDQVHRENKLIGTYSYMSPERIDPSKYGEPDQRCDIYAMGCVIYEMLTGQIAFTGDPASVFNQQLNQVPPPPGINSMIDEVVVKALDKKPDNRQYSAKELADELAVAIFHKDTTEKKSLFSFISYAREDAEFVLGVARELRQKGVSIWLDKFDIHPGDDWSRSVDAALECCEFFLLVVSPNSIASDNVMDELAAALEDGKRIVPLMYQSCRMPLRIRRLHYIDFTSEYESAMEALIATLAVPPTQVEEKPAQPKPEPKQPVQKAKFETRHENFIEGLPDGITLEMVAIPGGSFDMGGKRDDDEKPLHKVMLKPFFMGKYPVTQAQWKAAMDNNPSKFKGDNFPVEQVSWNDAQEFCKKLSLMTGKEYRLPTEAEWEYAARAGSTGKYCFGNYERLLKDYAWYAKTSHCHTYPVGQLKPNAWGLYDVHGNVLEWCEDVWHDDYKGAPTDGSAWLIGGDQETRGLRGGSWGYIGYDCRSAARFNFLPDARKYDVGFRVAVSART